MPISFFVWRFRDAKRFLRLRPLGIFAQNVAREKINFSERKLFENAFRFLNVCPSAPDS